MDEEVPIIRMSDPASGRAGYARTHYDAIDDMPEFYTKEEVNALLANQSNEKISPDGTVWISSISNEGVLTWDRKEEANERDQDK